MTKKNTETSILLGQFGGGGGGSGDGVVVIFVHSITSLVCASVIYTN